MQQFCASLYCSQITQKVQNCHASRCEQGQFKETAWKYCTRERVYGVCLRGDCEVTRGSHMLECEEGRNSCRHECTRTGWLWAHEDAGGMQCLQPLPEKHLIVSSCFLLFFPPWKRFLVIKWPSRSFAHPLWPFVPLLLRHHCCCLWGRHNDNN